jgi:hypothetical protein
MAWEALVWSCLGVLSWIWAAPWAVQRQPGIVRGTRTNCFLLLWFLPGLAFSALFHVGDPDQTLAFLPATCLMGATVLSSFEGNSRRVRTTIVSVAVALNAFLFFKPINGIATASTYKSVRWLNGHIDTLIDAVTTSRQRVVTVVFPDGVSGWRNVAYYAPTAALMVIGAENQASVSFFRIQDRRGALETSTREAVPIPSCGLIVFADPDRRSWDGADAPRGLVKRGNLWLFPAAPGLSFQSRGLRFVSEQTPCASNR